MQFIQEHRTQTYIVGLQSIVIVAGSLITGVMMKIFEDWGEWHYGGWPWIFRMVRSGGFLLLLIPAIWAYVTVRLERNDDINYRRIWTLVSGILVLFGLAIFFIICCLKIVPGTDGPIRAL